MLRTWLTIAQREGINTGPGVNVLGDFFSPCSQTALQGEAGAWARQIPLLDLEIEKIKIFFRPGSFLICEEWLELRRPVAPAPPSSIILIEQETKLPAQ